MTHCQPKSEPRNERAHQRGATMSSMVLGYRLALLTPIAFQHQGLTALQGRGLLPASGEGRYSAAARRIIWSRPFLVARRLVLARDGFVSSRGQSHPEKFLHDDAKGNVTH